MAPPARGAGAPRRVLRVTAVTRLAQDLNLDEALLRAVLRVECGTDRVPMDGVRPTIRVEAHHVLRHVEAGKGRSIPGPNVGMRIRDLATGYCWGGERGREPARAWSDPASVRHEIELDGVWRAYHVSQIGEWDALDVADAIVGPALATACTSWGMAQVMGVPELGLGWEQLRPLAYLDGGLGLLRLYLQRVRPQALDALRRRDLVAFAAAYNGSGQAQDYARRLSQALG